MSCPVCLGAEVVQRGRSNGITYYDSTWTPIDVVSCPRCVRGVSVLGTHELLKPTVEGPGWRTWTPGTVIGMSTGTDGALNFK